MLVERERELAVIETLVADIATSGGKVVLIRGEAGIGKSELVRELVRRLGDDANVMVGWCDDLSIPEPLGPIWDLVRVAPELGDPLGASDRMGLMTALLGVLSHPGRSTVLVFEDMQWADDATLDVVKYVGRRIARTGALLLLTYRDGEVDVDHPLRSVIADLPPGNVRRVHLEALTKSAVGKLIDATVLNVDEVFELTAGNPLFVTELASVGIVAIPASIQESVMARVSKLSGAARGVLEVLAVAPGGLESEVLAMLADVSPRVLAECARQGLLTVGDGEVVFHHELVRRAVESALDEPTRRRLNGEVMNAVGPKGHPARLAHHAVQSGDVTSIVRLARIAARDALDNGSLREALAHYRILEPHLALLDDQERAAIVQDWARSEFYLDNDSSIDILEQSIELHRAIGDDVALARTLTFAVRVNEVNGRPGAADACADEALKILDSRPPGAALAAALAQRGWLATMRWDHDIALGFADRASAIASDAGDELTMIQSLIICGYVRYSRGDPGGAVLLEQARGRAHAGRYWFEEARALIQLNAAALLCVRLDVAADAARRAMATAARYELRVLEAFAKVQLAEVLLATGDWLEAEDLAGEGLDSNAHLRLFAGWVLGRLHTRRGRRLAAQSVGQTWAQARTSAELPHLLATAGLAAEHLWLTGGDSVVAPRHLVEILHTTTEPTTAWARGDLAWWLWQAGHIANLPDDVLSPYRAAADGSARAAADEWARLGLPYERAIALSTGDPVDRVEALEALETLGASAVAAKLRKRLRADGIAVPRGRGRATRGHTAGLTARQAEVLEFLAGGSANADIADQLFVSLRTVENHVAAVLAKLDVGTRREAVIRAREQGLVTN